MKKLYLIAISAAVVACSENPNQPETPSLRAPSLTVITPPGVNLLKCFSGSDQPFASPNYGGTCTTSADHKKATLANTSSDTDGDFSGLYSDDLTVYGELLPNITDLSYTYKSLNVPAIVPTPGVLIYEVPIDTNNDALLDFWAYIDASTCGGKTGATVNIVKMDKCAIVDGSPALHAQPFVNWAAFVAAYPAARVTNLHEYIMIISARVPPAGANSWLISNVTFGKTGLVCFDGTRDGFGAGGSCTLGKDFKSATLDNPNNDPDISYAGVYSKETTGYGLFLSNIKDFTLKFSGLNAPQPGELVYFIPISNNFSGTKDFRAVVDMAVCPGTVSASGVHTVNITRDAVCQIATDNSPTTYPNWAAFAAAYPNAITATDQTGDNYYTNWIVLQATRQVGDPANRFVVSDVKWGARR